jgi:hypothetical protein
MTLLAKMPPGIALPALLGAQIRSDVRGIALLVFAMVLAAAAVAAAFYIRKRLMRPAVAAATARLFDDLCRVHSLSNEDRGVLGRAAAVATYTSVVFVDPRLLERHGLSNPQEAAACTRLRERLFGT